MKTMGTLIMVVSIAVITVPVVAQTKRPIAYNSLAANSKFTQQHALDVGDVPGHQVRIYEHHRTYPTDPPVFDGVHVTPYTTLFRSLQRLRFANRCELGLFLQTR